MRQVSINRSDHTNMFSSFRERNLLVADFQGVVGDKQILLVGQYKELGFVWAKINVKTPAVVEGQVEDIQESEDIIGEESNIICLTYRGNCDPIAKINTLA